MLIIQNPSILDFPTQKSASTWKSVNETTIEDISYNWTVGSKNIHHLTKTTVGHDADYTDSMFGRIDNSPGRLWPTLTLSSVNNEGQS